MKTKLPLLSTLALAALAAAATAQRSSIGRQIDAQFAANDAASDAERAAVRAPYTSSAVSRATQATMPADDVLPVGDRLLRQAIGRLDERDSVSARLRHQVALDGQQYYGVGSYWQQGRGDDLQTRLELQIAGQEASLLQISNGRFLWVDRRLPTGRVVSRIDLRELRADVPVASEEPADATADWPDEARLITPPRTSDFLLISVGGGLRGLLASLGENFSFLPPQAMRLSVSPPLAAQTMDVPVYAVVGHWKPARLDALLNVAEGGNAPNQNANRPAGVPDRFPQEVLLLFGQADLFPYRVEYRRLETPGPVADRASTTIYQLSAHPMVVLELTDVRFDAPIAAGSFDYLPGSPIYTDQTPAVRERLRGQRQQQLAERARPAAAR
jgi:hypothetical protein